jgi:hypothetical protein
VSGAPFRFLPFLLAATLGSVAAVADSTVAVEGPVEWPAGMAEGRMKHETKKPCSEPSATVDASARKSAARTLVLSVPGSQQTTESASSAVAQPEGYRQPQHGSRMKGRPLYVRRLGIESSRPRRSQAGRTMLRGAISQPYSLASDDSSAARTTISSSSGWIEHVE